MTFCLLGVIFTFPNPCNAYLSIKEMNGQDNYITTF